MRYLIFLLIILIGGLSPLQAQTPEKPNIIFIMTDDMNDYVEGFAGHPQAETPHIAGLAEMGTVFTNGFANSVLCASSRTSFMSGLVPEHTGVMINASYDCDFRSNFPEGQLVYTFPQLLKDSGGYYTVSVGKLFHCDNGFRDYDESTSNPCERELSWSQTFVKDLSPAVNDAGQANPEGISEIKWSAIDSSLVTLMPDFQALDSAVWFLDQYASDPGIFCDRPFLMTLGIQKPHSHLYIPEQFFKEDYITDFLAEPFDINYNYPEGTYPFNGLVLPPQPAIPYSDYDELGILAKEQIALSPHNQFNSWYTDLAYIPEIDPGLTLTERQQILVDAKRANGIMAYLAGIKFVDEMVGRLLDTLDNHPDLYNNTIIIFSSDHGYAWGEKKHYGKSQLWDTDVRVPFLIVDLRNPVGQRVTQAVSLVDLFPTLLEFGGVDMPNDLTGEPYADGHSLVPILNNPNLKWERPVLSQVKNSLYSNVCHPQNSIRDDRFHFIQFRSNGAGSSSDCDFANSYTESLLYEVGTNREIDPNEWNNLANDPAYAPVVAYYESFLPGGDLFLDKMFTAVVIEKTPKCFYSSAETIQLRPQLFNENGNQIIGGGLSAYTFKWTNNLTNDTITGLNLTFDVSDLSAAQYATNDRIFFYLHVTDNLTGKLVAFEVKSVFINPTNKPNAAFNVATDGLSATITDYTINGTYTNVSWNMGDGFTTDLAIPGPYTYGGSGTYNIRHIINYGNGCKRTIKRTATVTMLTEEELARKINTVQLYPNPANAFVSLQLNSPVNRGELTVYSSDGQIIEQFEIDPDQTYLTLLTHQYPSGLYYVQIIGNDTELRTKFEIVR